MEISGETRAVALFGYPVGHTLSPPMQNAAFRELNIPCIYLPFEVHPDLLEAAVRGLVGMNFLGANVTVPHKTRIIEYMDELDEEARAIGAVNTVHNVGGKLIGYSTDGVGFSRSLLEELNETPRGRRVFIFGAGGAARTLAFRMAEERAEAVFIANRTESKAEALARDVKARHSACEIWHIPFEEMSIRDRVKESDIFINATSLGMKGEALPFLDEGCFRPGAVVCDIVYNCRTPLLDMAERAGLRTMDGVGMLVHQGAEAFEIWTGCKAPVGLMRRVLEEKLARGNKAR
ncbi:MAG: shikimate dehydrogenase [bacterium]